jgi:phosphatidate cytidylyltransferase
VNVTGSNPVNKGLRALAQFVGRNNLALRIATALVLAPLAVASAYLGGPVFVIFWTVAALGVLWEWDTLVCTHDRKPVLTIGAAALVGAGLLLIFQWSGMAVALIMLGVLGVATLASGRRRSWCAAGLVYAAALLLAPAVLRHDELWGFAAILFVFAVVWLTDIAAYAVGRLIGGPKLLPRVSPNKTWSGAAAGALAGVIGGVVTARQFGLGNLTAIGAVALSLSIISQAGDLVESAIKRHFGAKDTSSLIPGHGGLMDRLDSFLAAATAATLIGLVHSKFDAPARGLMVW